MNKSTAPFNIHISYHGEQLVLTVSPAADQYRLIYNGGIIGAIKKASDWQWLPEEEIVVGDLPLLSDKKGLANEQLPLGLPDINHIVGEIENFNADESAS